MENDKEKEQIGFDSGLGSLENPIQLPEVVVYGKRPNWFMRNIVNPLGRHVLAPVGRFINDEILLNKGNIRVKDALRHPETMNAILEGGNIAGLMVTAPFAAYGAALAAPVVWSGVKALLPLGLPSTYINAASSALGYNAPAWLGTGADFAMSAKFAWDAGTDLQREGLNWRTGVNAGLSMLPMVGDSALAYRAFNEVGRGVNNLLNSSRTLRTYRIANAFNKGVRDTRFSNVPVYHATNYLGNDLRPFSMTDWGLHVTPNPQTAQGIVLHRPNDRLHIKEGVFTYSNNTGPARISDQGNFLRGLGDFDYTGVQRYDNFLPENISGLILAFGFSPNTNPRTFRRRFSDYLFAKDNSPSYVYHNLFEGGGDSFAILDPERSVVFSENVRAYDMVPPTVKVSSSTPALNPSDMSQNLLGMFGMNPTGTAEVLRGGNRYTAFRVPENVYTRLIQPRIEEIESFLDSPMYTARWQARGVSDPSHIVGRIKGRMRGTQFYHYADSNPGVVAATSSLLAEPIVTFNTSSRVNPKLSTSVYHEVGGHAGEIPVVREFNRELVGDWKSQLLLDYDLLSDLERSRVDYLFKDAPDGAMEIRGQLWPAVLEMYNKGLTADLLLASNFAETNHNLKHLLERFDEDYIKKLLTGLLSATPIVLASNGNN